MLYSSSSSLLSQGSSNQASVSSRASDNNSTTQVILVNSTTAPITSLNVDAPPFFSSTNPAQVPGVHARKKNKSDPKATTISPEAAKINYLNLELNATKTRKVKLETDIKDRDITIKLQKETIRQLGQNQVEFINKKYSIHPQAPPPQCHRCTNAPPFICSKQSYQLPVCPTACHIQCKDRNDHHYHHGHHHREQHPHQQSDGNAMRKDNEVLLENLKDIKSAVKIIQDGLFSITSGLQESNTVEAEIVDLGLNTSTIPNDPSNTAINNERSDDPDHIETVAIEIINSLDDSTATIDELVPEIPTSEPNLNCLVQTIQQK